MKNSIIYLFVIALITSCTSNQSDKTNSDTSIQKNEKVSFQITQFIDASFIPNYYRADYTPFITTFEVTNNTQNKITSFLFDNPTITAVFVNNEIVKAPEQGCSESFWPVPQIDMNNPWLPNTTRKFTIRIPINAGGCTTSAFCNYHFERTPTNVTFTLKYVAISIDGEFRQSLSFDVMDQWKDCQKRLGYRK